eukprot:g3211.t1
MAAIASDTNDPNERLQQLGKKPFKAQIVWFLNGFWGKFFANSEEDRENMWKYMNLMTELSKENEAGCELDEFGAHRFLEKCDGALTVTAFRAAMKAIDVNVDKKMSMLEFLIYRYKVTVKDVVNAPQAANEEAAKEIEKAQAKLDASGAAMAAAVAADEAASKAHEEAAAAEKAAADALAEMERQQKEFDDKCAELEAKGNDDSLGVVKRNRAKQELAQMKASDPLPLQRAKINQGATVRKSKKAAKKAKKAADAAAEARAAAEEAFAAAQEAVDEIKKKYAGSGEGGIWLMDRELEEQKKYMSPAQLRKLEKQNAAKKN